MFLAPVSLQPEVAAQWNPTPPTCIFFLAFPFLQLLGVIWILFSTFPSTLSFTFPTQTPLVPPSSYLSYTEEQNLFSISVVLMFIDIQFVAPKQLKSIVAAFLLLPPIFIANPARLNTSSKLQFSDTIWSKLPFTNRPSRDVNPYFIHVKLNWFLLSLSPRASISVSLRHIWNTAGWTARIGLYQTLYTQDIQQRRGELNLVMCLPRLSCSEGNMAVWPLRREHQSLSWQREASISECKNPIFVKYVGVYDGEGCI